MATKKRTTERVFGSLDELTRELLPSEVAEDIEAGMDATELGQALAVESLTVMQQALSSGRSSSEETTKQTRRSS